MLEVKKMVEVKRSNPELFACGNTFELVSEDYPLVFKRTNGEEVFLCAVNPSEKEYVLDIKWGEVLAASNVLVEEETVVMKGVSYVWMKHNDHLTREQWIG